MSVQSFTIEHEVVRPFMVNYNNPFLNSDNFYDVDDSDPNHHNYTIWAFGSQTINSVDPERLLEQLNRLLIALCDDEEGKIFLLPEHRENFLFLLFHYQALREHITMVYKFEQHRIKSIKQWIQAKIRVMQGRAVALNLKLESGYLNFIDTTGFSEAIDNVLNIQIALLIEDYSELGLSNVTNSGITVEGLKAIDESFKANNGHHDDVIRIAAYKLSQYLNQFAVIKTTKGKKLTLVNSNHLRFLSPFFEILKWKHNTIKKDLVSGKFSDTKAIKNLREFLNRS